MAKVRTLKSTPSKTAAQAGAGVRRFFVHFAGFVAFAACLGAIIVSTRKYVEEHEAAPTGPLTVVLKEQPVWMSDFLAQQIVATVPRAGGSAFDRDVLVHVADRLRENPWVREVRQVRRVYGNGPGDTLEVDCDFRAPIALVQWGDYYWLVDGDGLKLPEQFMASHVPQIVIGRDGRMNIRIIEGVKQPPPETGQRWGGQDVQAGLGMVKLLYGKAYAEEIVTVNVANFGGRKDPREAQIVLRTKYATEVRWGRPLDARDFFAEVPVSQKLDDLKAVVEQYGRVDAGRPWIDIRYDKITYPKAEASSGAAAQLEAK